MLNIPAPFPQVGSYTLHDIPGGPRLARIQRRETIGGADQALISYPSRVGSSGMLTVPLSSLLDGTALSIAEYAELGELDRTATQLGSKRRARRSELNLRRIYNTVLVTQLAAVGVEQRESVAA